VILTTIGTVLAVVVWLGLFWEYLEARRERQAEARAGG
jgi:hypothetical protein